MIIIREFEIGDEDGLWSVFYTSIRQVCSNDYTNEQVQSWAPDDLDPTIWVSKMQSIKPYVAIVGGRIVGYADLQEDGKIDHFFVHGDHQGQGVGHSLMEKIIEKSTNKRRLYSEVSYTAKPFYEKSGFKVANVQKVNMRRVELTNNIMERFNSF